MKRGLILFFIICVISCSKDVENEPSARAKLKSIEYTGFNQQWIVNYLYSSTGQLINIGDETTTYGSRYEIKYEGSSVKEIYNYSTYDNLLYSRDSIVYQSDGNIQDIYHFSLNGNNVMALASISEVEYDNNKQVSKITTCAVDSNKQCSVSKYFWAGDNVKKVESYNSEGELIYEYFYKYDDKKNYQFGFPISLYEPASWGKNNVVESIWVDYTGLIDVSCNPCTTKYKYNSQGYPVYVKFDYDMELNIKYE